MNEEEKQAIKYFKALDKLTFEPYLSILLNLFDKQQKEIEYFKNEKERIGKLQYDASETCFKNKEIIQKQQKEIEELKKDNENQWRHRCKMAIELDYNVVSKDKIREILNKYGKKDIGYAVDFYKEIEKLLED